MNQEKIDKYIAECRKKSKLTQEQLAEKIGVTRQTISNWELEESSPDINQAKESSKVFNICLDELVNNTKYINNNEFSKYYEYVSKTKIKGITLVYINLGLGNEIRKANGITAIGNHVKGSIEVLQNEVSSSEIKNIILQHFPKTWNVIVSLISNLTFK